MTLVIIIGSLVAVAMVLLMADRALLKMEERGWIYYRKKQGHADRIGQAALRLQAILEPSKRYVIEEKNEDRREERHDGAPPA
jgi:hypothetical protein